jgi:hypothetical protein
MKRLILLLIFQIFISQVFSQTNLYRLYISPNGNDRDNGSIEKPLKTLEAARDLVRILKNIAVGDTKFEIIFREGVYSFKKTIEFNEKDKGTFIYPIEYKANENEKVVFTGGIEIDCNLFKKVNDKAVFSLLKSDIIRKNLVYINLFKLGISNYGNMKFHGFNRPIQIAPMELFYNDKPMQLAQYPNSKGEFIKISSVIDTGSVPRYGDLSNRGASFIADDEQIERWTSAKDLWVQGMFGTIWADDFLKVSELDSKKRIFKTSKPHVYGVSGGHFKAINLIEELDTVGEYYIDREKGILYFLPPYDMKNKKIQLSILETPFLALENTSFIKFEGITFQYCRGMGIYIEGGEGNKIIGCTLKNMGMLAISIGRGVEGDSIQSFTGTGKSMPRTVGDLRKQLYSDIFFDRQAGKNHGIISCKIFNQGCGGISLGGGNRKTLEAAGNYVENCEIYETNRWEKTYRPCVDISGVGNKVSHCYMHDATHSAILLAGNDHLIEFNVFENTLSESNDVGVIYTGRDPSAYGCVIRYNFFKNNGPSEKYFPHPYSQGIYLDDFNSRTTVESNIFIGVKTSIFASGWDTKINNNLIIGCGPITFQLRYFNEITMKRLYSVNPNQPPYAVRYPEILKHLGKHEQSGWAYGSEVINNVCVYRKKSCLIFDKVPLDAVLDSGNISITEDPLFVDEQDFDFRLKPESIIFKLLPEFKNIPSDKIGLYPTKYFLN